MARLIVCDFCNTVIPNEGSLYRLTCEIPEAIYNKGMKPAFKYEICRNCAEELYTELDFIKEMKKWQR